jgi:hypothetical protein
VKVSVAVALLVVAACSGSKWHGPPCPRDGGDDNGVFATCGTCRDPAYTCPLGYICSTCAYLCRAYSIFDDDAGGFAFCPAPADAGAVD